MKQVNSRESVISLKSLIFVVALFRFDIVFRETVVSKAFSTDFVENNISSEPKSNKLKYQSKFRVSTIHRLNSFNYCCAH